MSDELRIDVTVDLSSLGPELEKLTKAAQKVLDSQVLKDSNYYCPMDTGTLQKSGILHTVLGSGLIIWDTPYAHKQYYEVPTIAHRYSRNPNATYKWFETAKANRIKEWEKAVNEVYSKGN